MEISFLGPEGTLQRVPLAQAAGLPFYDGRPVRVPPSYRGQGHWPGLYWCATTRAFVAYESRLELSQLLLLDFDADVVALSAQPFRLYFPHGAVEHSHVPDFFVRLADGRERVVDVKPSRKLHEPKVRAVFDATQEACHAAGWDYEVLSEPMPVLLENVRWLAGFRRPMYDPGLAARVLGVCRLPVAVGSVTAQVLPHALARATLFHLLWIRKLSADLTRPLSNATIVSAS
jgi:hypothetical protein